MRKLSPLELARRWWKERVDAERYVVAPSEAPSAAIARVLRQEGLVLDVAGKRAWILTPERPADARAVFLANYWPVVALVLERYAPAAVAGLSAVKLRLEDFSPPVELPVYHAANRSEYTLTLYPGFVLRLRPRALPVERLAHVSGPGKADIPVLSAADTLTTLDEPDIAAGLEAVSAWLRHQVIRTPELEQAVDDNPRPLILHRLADLAKDIDNAPLAKQLDAAARRISTRTFTPSSTGVGTRIQIPQVLRDIPRGVGSPWMDEQAMRLARQEAQVDELLGKQIAKLPTFPWRLLRSGAEQTKAYDTYHSTTMEGYRISREVSDAILRGEPLPDGPQDRATLDAVMAVQGYGVAFNEVIERARTKAPVNSALILDLAEALFRPSVDAGITDTAALRGWRTSSVGLRGWMYVPPNPKKIPDLIGGLERFAARSDLTAVARALLVHLEFVTIHPFMDGNGRLGRLLMNYVLLSAGLPWVTIRNDERTPFFKTIERAQVGGDAGPFMEFLWHLIQQSVKEMEGRSRTRKKKRGKSTRRA